MYPELIHQLVLERTARFQRDADQYRQAREGHISPPERVWTSIELRLSACRKELERLTRHRRAAGPSTE